VYIKCDGGSRGNPGPAAAAFVAFDNGRIVARHVEFLGVHTNNEAEYMAVIAALAWVQKYEPRSPIYTDSMVVANQIMGEYRCGEKRLQKLKEIIDKKFRTRVIRFIHREDNVEADKLVKELLDQWPKNDSLPEEPCQLSLDLK
jgi:ribonuclease HI